MNVLVNRYATPFTTGLFIVSTVSGVALFFHWQSGAFHAMHEWLSMLLLVPFVFHVWKNWRSLLGYLKNKSLVVALVLSLIVAVPFVVPTLTGERSGGGNPAFRAIPLLTNAPIADVAPILKTTPDALVATLKQRGYDAASAETTLAALAAEKGEPANRLLFGLMPGR